MGDTTNQNDRRHRSFEIVRQDPDADSTPQERYHFRMLDQVNALVGARDAEPDVGFMVRLMMLCSLPRSNPGSGKSTSVAMVLTPW